MNQVTEADFASWEGLATFVARKVAESTMIEYKRDPYADPRKPPERQREEKDELRRDVASIANAGGGWLIIGVSEHTTGEPHELVGMSGLRDHENRARDTLSTRLSPPLSKDTSVRVVFRPGSDSDGALVIRVGSAAAHRPVALLREHGVLEFWIRKDKSKRPMGYSEIAGALAPTPDELQAHTIAANARSHIETVRHAIRAADQRWACVAELARELRQYCEHRSLEVRRDVVRAVYEVIDYPRSGLPPELAFEAADILRDALPIYSLVSRHHRPMERAEIELLDEAVGYVWPLVYDGIKRVRNLSMMWAGAEVLSDLLRFARLNGLEELAEKATDQLQGGISVARELRDNDSERLLTYAIEGACDSDVRLPKGLAWVVQRDTHSQEGNLR